MTLPHSRPLPAIVLAVPMRAWTWSTTFNAFAALTASLPPGSDYATTADTPADVAGARNKIAASFLRESESRGWKYVLFVDSDMLPPPDTALYLVAVAEAHDLDILAIPYCSRAQPFHDFVAPLDGRARPTEGLHEVKHVGFGCTLVNRRVLAAMSEPFFEYLPGLSGSGECEVFCDKARALGFRIWADYDRDIGHLTVMSVTLRKGRIGFTPLLAH